MFNPLTLLRAYENLPQQEKDDVKQLAEDAIKNLAEEEKARLGDWIAKQVAKV